MTHKSIFEHQITIISRFMVSYILGKKDQYLRYGKRENIVDILVINEKYIKSLHLNLN